MMIATLGSRVTVKSQRLDEMVVGAVKDEESFDGPPHQLSQPILLAFMFRPV